ncbi:putative reverse transcriptase domain-containing protein [Tanacetum coccineum]
MLLNGSLIRDTLYRTTILPLEDAQTVWIHKKLPSSIVPSPIVKMYWAEGIENTAKNIRTTYHPQSYGQSERTIQTLKDMLRAKYRSHVLWAEIGEIRSIKPELVQETTNKVILIKEKLKVARDCQKSYVGNMRKHLELKLYLADTNLHVHFEEIKVDKTLRFVEEPVEIIDREVKSLKRSRILIVKSIGTRSEFGYQSMERDRLLVIEVMVVMGKRFWLLCVGMNLCGYNTKSLGLGIALLSMTLFCGLDQGTRSIPMVIVGERYEDVEVNKVARETIKIALEVLI